MLPYSFTVKLEYFTKCAFSVGSPHVVKDDQLRLVDEFALYAILPVQLLHGCLLMPTHSHLPSAK